MRWRSIERSEHSGRTLLVRRLGLDAGPQFVLVHGIGVSPRYFSRLAEVLSRTGGVHAVELPGHGSAPKPRESMSVEDYADVVLGYLDQAGLSEAMLVGHSMGAQIVTAMAIKRPAIPQIVLMSAVVDPRQHTPFSVGLRLLQDGFVEPLDVLWTEISDYFRCGPRWYLKTVPAMMSYRMEHALPRVQADTLVVRGTRDPISRHDWGVTMTKLLRRSRLVEIEGSGHVVMQTAAADVARELLAHSRRGASLPDGDRLGLS